MTRTAQEIAAAIRAHLPDVPAVKLQKLLYYCQGHHLAATGEALFSDPITAYDMGPVVTTLWRAERDGEVPLEMPDSELTEAQLNTIGYVVHRYGSLTGTDLKHMSHGEGPWRDADVGRPQGGRAPISVAAIQRFFEEQADAEAREARTPSRRELDQLVAGANERRSRHVEPDSISEITKRLADLRR